MKINHRKLINQSKPINVNYFIDIDWYRSIDSHIKLPANYNSNTYWLLITFLMKTDEKSQNPVSSISNINQLIAVITVEPAVQWFPCESAWKWGVWVMINSENSELKQTVRGNIPSNAYFAEEKHVQMFSGACTHHMTKAISSPIPPCYFGWSIHRLCNASSLVKWVRSTTK